MPALFVLTNHPHFFRLLRLLLDILMTIHKQNRTLQSSMSKATLRYSRRLIIFLHFRSNSSSRFFRPSYSRRRSSVKPSTSSASIQRAAKSSTSTTCPNLSGRMASTRERGQLVLPKLLGERYVPFFTSQVRTKNHDACARLAERRMARKVLALTLIKSRKP